MGCTQKCEPIREIALRCALAGPSLVPRWSLAGPSLVPRWARDGVDRRGNVGKRHEEGGDLNRLWRTRHQTTQGGRR